MQWVWRVFIAPGEEDEGLPTVPTSWHQGRMVRVLQGHWDTIVQYASEIDAERAENLDSMAQEQEQDAPFLEKDIADQIEFIAMLIRRLESDPQAAIPYAEDDPDHFDRSVYVDMLLAVQAVLAESLRYGKPFQSWLDA